jgi:hypothetical protein
MSKRSGAAAMGSRGPSWGRPVSSADIEIAV